MPGEPSDNELERRIADLEAAVDDLKNDLQPTPTGPLGLPRPPTPREILRFTDNYAIPLVITVLEANIRALKLLQDAIRVTDSERKNESARAVRDSAVEKSKQALTELEQTLAELQSSLESGGLPEQPEARRILKQARKIRREILTELDTVRDDDSFTDDTESTADSVTIDIESELESIKDELDDQDATSDEEDNDPSSNKK